MEPLDLFLCDHEGHVKRLHLALQAHSFEEIRRLLHTMKGNADVFGFSHLVKYIHTLEWFVEKIQAGALVLDGKTLNFLENSFSNLQGALAIYRIDPQNPLTLKEKIAEMLQFIRSCVAKPLVPRGEAVAPISQPTNETPLNNTAPESPRFFLHIRQGAKSTYVPCHQIVRVLRKVSFLKIQENQGQTKALARIGSQLVPVQTFENDLLDCEWTLLMRDPVRGQLGHSDFCMLAHEILGVMEMPLAGADNNRMYPVLVTQAV